MLNKVDILRHISDALDPDDLIDRLRLDTADLVTAFREEILDNLGRFSDVYDDLDDVEFFEDDE